jgi:ribonuclease P protein component
MVFANVPVLRAARRFSSGGEHGEERNLPSEAGLARCERIARGFEYKEIVTKGRRLNGKAMRVYVLVNAGLERKAGFIAGKHVGNACRRNRSKRLLREAYRKLKHRLPAQGFKVVFVATSVTPRTTAADINTEMARMFERCNLMDEV